MIYILLPLSLLLTVLLISQGTVQTFSSRLAYQGVEGQNQVLFLGPAASQIAIKQLGANGGGFFGANSAHPFENPTLFSNFLENIAILLIPTALIFTFGFWVKNWETGAHDYNSFLIFCSVGFYRSGS